MNILFLLTNYPGFGGIEKVTTYITSFLYDKGYSIYILAFGTNTPTLIDSLTEDITLDFVPEQADYASHNNMGYIRRYLESHDFDFVVFQDSYAPIEHLFQEIDYPWVQKLIVVEHNSPMFAIKTVNSYFYYKKGLDFLLERIIKYPVAVYNAFTSSRRRHTLLLKKCRRYILLSDAFRSELKILNSGVNHVEIQSITNPLTIPVLSIDASFIKKKQILFVGRMTNQKGINFLLPVWKEFSILNNEGWNLVILGDGPMRKEIETYITKEHLENIWIDSPTSEIVKYYEESSILVMTSIFEGFGLVLAEAMSRGCVPIAFDSFKSVRDIIDNEVNGVLIQPFNIQQYASQLKRLTQDKDVLRSMSFAARDSVKKFDIDSIGAQWADMFEQLLR